MALHLKEKPVSIDALCNSIAKRLYGLNEVWGLTQVAKNLLEGYGRVYVNNDQGGMIAEDFVKNTDYTKTLLTGDKSKFFILKDPVSKQIAPRRYQTKLEVCFLVDLKVVKKNITHRADEEVHTDVDKVLRSFSQHRCSIESYTTGIQNVFRGLQFDYKDDIQPKHAFKFTMNVEYSTNQTEC